MSHQKPVSGNKYAALALPQRQLDFHQLGLLTPQQIKNEVESFLQKASADGLKKVLIITGKGLHSKDSQSVIKPLVQKYLSQSDLIKTFSFAPVNMGAEGAILVTMV